MTYRKRRKISSYVKEHKQLELSINEELLIMGCWRFERRYQKLDGIYLHRQWAHGEGEIVRHLCGDSRCVNPLHLVKGSDVENAMDELTVRDFSIKILQKLLGEEYDDKHSKELSILILIPRVRRVYSNRFRTMKDVVLYAREEYRIQFEKGFAESYDEEIDIDRFNKVRQRFISLASRNDINIRRIKDD